MILFGIQALLAAALEYGNRLGSDNKHSAAPPEFLSFRNNYLVVYSLMMGKTIVDYRSRCSSLLAARRPPYSLL